MLTGDPIEALEQARAFLKKGSVEVYYDEIVLGALRLAEADAALGRLDDERLEKIHQTVAELIEDLGAHETSDKKEKTEDESNEKTNVIGIDTRKLALGVFCIPGLGKLDYCAALVLADFLKRRGVFARTAAVATEIEANTAKTLCVCYLEAISSVRIDFTMRKFARQAPSAKILVCQFGNPLEEGSSGRLADDGALRSLETVLLQIENNVLKPSRKER